MIRSVLYQTSINHRTLGVCHLSATESNLLSAESMAVTWQCSGKLNQWCKEEPGGLVCRARCIPCTPSCIGMPILHPCLLRFLAQNLNVGFGHGRDMWRGKGAPKSVVEKAVHSRKSPARKDWRRSLWWIQVMGNYSGLAKTIVNYCCLCNKKI